MIVSRKNFLRLSSAAGVAAAAGLGNATAAQVSRPAATNPPRRTLIKNADVLTMDTAGELKGVDVLIDNGVIVQIAPGIQAGDAIVIDATDMILMPGMSDGHRHVWEILELGRLVKGNPTPYSAEYQTWKMLTMPCLTAEDHYFGGYIGGLQAIDTGVTTILDYAHGQHTVDRAVSAARGLKDSGIAGWYCAQIGHTINYGPGDTLPLAQASAARGAFADEAAWENVIRVQEDVLSDTSAALQMGVAFSNGSMGKPLAVVKEREWDKARSLGIRMFAHHSHKPASAAPAGHFGHRDSGIRDLYEAGILGPEYHLSHGTKLTPDELQIMAQEGVMLCATAMGEFPYRLAGNGVAAHGRARAAGVATGIGIDVSLALPLDYFEHVRGAFWSHFMSDEGTEIVGKYTSADSLDFVTRSGAKALRLGDVSGTITVGKRADLVLLRTDRFGFSGLGTLADRVFTFATQFDIDSVWVGGRLLKNEGKMIGVDWKALNRKLSETQKRVGEQAATITFT